MRRSDFHYDLPARLIAQHPPAERGDSRLLYLDANSGAFEDYHFKDIDRLITPGDLLVFNDTKVVPARLRGHKDSGGRVEVLVERLLGEQRILAQVRASKTPKVGGRLIFPEGVEARVEGRRDEFFVLEFSSTDDDNTMAILERIGSMPLPPYIQRGAEPQDATRYQTVFAQKPGAVAAPTAGLHFTEPLLQRLEQKGVEPAYLTLHVGAGTFQPVRVDDVSEHTMHAEWIDVPAPVVERIEAARARGAKVIAVGTTVVRSLETAAQNGALQPFCGETDIFITPGFEFKVVDALLTNFHLPESTLLMLVCAFGGYDQVLAAYRHAIEQEYRFFSYGDAMFIDRCR